MFCEANHYFNTHGEIKMYNLLKNLVLQAPIFLLDWDILHMHHHFLYSIIYSIHDSMFSIFMSLKMNFKVAL